MSDDRRWILVNPIVWEFCSNIPSTEKCRICIFARCSFTIPTWSEVDARWRELKHICFWQLSWIHSPDVAELRHVTCKTQWAFSIILQRFVDLNAKFATMIQAESSQCHHCGVQTWIIVWCRRIILITLQLDSEVLNLRTQCQLWDTWFGWRALPPWQCIYCCMLDAPSWELSIVDKTHRFWATIFSNLSLADSKDSQTCQIAPSNVIMFQHLAWAKTCRQFQN